LRWLFGKKESSASKKAKENVKACKKALNIIRKCDSISEKEIRKLVETMRKVNPDIDEAWFRKIIGMANMGYLSYVNRMMSSGQKPADQKRFVKDTLESQLMKVLAAWEKIARSL